MADRDIALALSGGGYRAAFFHLGVLRKLHEFGLLERIGVISSVSGGSIVAGAYAQSLLDDEDFDTFVERVREFLESQSLDVPAILKGVIPWRTSSWNLERKFSRLYRRNNGKRTMMSDLDKIDGPRFVLNTTAVHSGRGWRFVSGGTVEEWEFGITHDVAFSRKVDRYSCDISLAKAVTASADFPIFTAVTIARDKLTDIEEEGAKPGYFFFKDLTDPICLSDGGVRDNTGLTSIVAGQAPRGFEDDYYLIGSDAGAPIHRLRDPPSGLGKWLSPGHLFTAPPRGRLRKFGYLMRQFEIRGNHNDTVIKALYLKDHRTRGTSQKGAAMFRIEEIVFVREEDVEEIADLARIGTRLKPPGWNHREQLMKHGENLVWARLTEYTDLLSKNQKMRGVSPRQHKE